MFFLLAQQAPQTSTPDFMDILSGFPFWMWIVFAGMLMSTIFGLGQMIIKHRERIEMIRHGQTPPPDND